MQDQKLKSKEKQTLNTNNTNKQRGGEVVDDWRTRINWEKIYKIVAYVIVALIPFFIRDMQNFREAIQKVGHTMMPWSFMAQVLVSTIVFTLVRKAYFLGTHNYIFSKILPQYQGQARELHTQKVQKWTFDFVYYSATTIYGFLCFRETSWYPLNISHKEEDDTLGLYSEWPNLPISAATYKYMDFFLVVQFGHHTWAVWDLLVNRRKTENKFYEMFLHHMLAWTLIFYSSYFNFITIGISVLIVHDIGDIFIVMFKTCGEFTNKGILFKYLVFQMIVGWFISRVYLFPKVIIYPIIVFKRQYAQGEIFELASATYIYQTIMLCLLYLLHLYWFATMITLLVSFITKGLKRGNKQNQEQGYGNEFDYYQYNKNDKKSNKKE